MHRKDDGKTWPWTGGITEQSGHGFPGCGQGKPVAACAAVAPVQPKAARTPSAAANLNAAATKLVCRVLVVKRHDGKPAGTREVRISTLESSRDETEPQSKHGLTLNVPKAVSEPNVMAHAAYRNPQFRGQVSPHRVAHRHTYDPAGQ